MAFTVEDGTGLPEATAFLTVANLKAYADDRGLSYASFADAALEQAIVRTSDFLTHAFAWQGWRVNERGASGGRQGLAWPRTGVVDGAGYSVPNNTVPQEVKDATAEAALVEAATPGTFAPSYTPHSRVKSEKVGPLAVEYDLSDFDARGARPTLLKVNELIGQFLKQGGRSRLSGETTRV